MYETLTSKEKLCIKFYKSHNLTLSYSNNYDCTGIEKTAIATRSLPLKKYYQKKKTETIYFDQFSELTVKSTRWACNPFLRLLGIKPFSNIVLV